MTFGQLCKQEVDSLKNKELYKDTEVGRIPVDWEVKRLGEVSSSITDGTHATPRYVDDGIPFYSVENVTENNFSDTKYISEDEHKKLIKRCKPEKGDVLLTRIGTLGKTKLIDWDVNASIYVSLALIKVNNNKVDVNYLYRYSKSSMFVENVKKRSLLNAVPQKINMEDIGDIPLPLPPLLEQKAIAKVLSDIDELIESIEKLIHKKKQIKQGAMQELLTGKKRLAGFSGEWEVKRLGEIADIRTGKRNNEDKLEDGEYPFFVRSQNIERIDSYSYDGEAILVPGEGGIGDIYHYINGKFDYHQRVYKISDFPEDIDGKFVYYYMMQNFRHHALKSTVKATVDSLRLPTFEDFKLYLPPLPEQKAIAQILSDMDAEIEALEKKLDKYRKIKEGMMEKLLTGQVRLV